MSGLDKENRSYSKACSMRLMKCSMFLAVDKNTATSCGVEKEQQLTVVEDDPCCCCCSINWNTMSGVPVPVLSSNLINLLLSRSS